jgi:DNA-binding NarL/FixJ family response regulator
MQQSPIEKGYGLIIEDDARTAEVLRTAVTAVFPQLNVMSFGNLRETSKWLDAYESGASGSAVELALVDLGLPDGSGVNVIHRVRALAPEAINLVVTIYAEDSFLFEALRAGAFGYLLKDDGLSLIEESLRKVGRFEPPMSPAIARRVLGHFHADKSPAADDSSLSPRQKQTLTLLARGLTIAEVAAEMGLAHQTIASYVKIIYQKLHVSNRAEATREAIRRGYT